MKKTILINSYGDEKWVGGLYYRRNIAFQLTMNDYIRQEYNIVILSSDSVREIYASIPGIKIICTRFENGTVRKILKGIFCILNNVKIEFPLYRDNTILGITTVSWIPDFQHKHYPSYFKIDELKKRDDEYEKMRRSRFPLVLSSKDALDDFYQFYSNKDNAYIVPFVSFIEPEIRSLTQDSEDDVLSKHKLIGEQYAVIMNQFWQHKNHIVVFQAIKCYLELFPNSDFQFVFTGQMEDYRNPDYIERLKTLALDPVIASHISILGFIDREEQIAIMKNASFVIQPSLFEGWGTVVEDAKVLDKTILLSDIPVHHEQMNDKCILFDPHDPVALADLIYQETQKEHHDDVAKGIADMHKRAKEYSKGFEQLLRDLEKKK